MAIVVRYMCCLVFISRSSDLIQYGGIVTKANMRSHRRETPVCRSHVARADCAGAAAVWSFADQRCAIAAGNTGLNRHEADRKSRARAGT